MNNSSFVFFGTSHFSVLVLDELKAAGFLPALVVSVPDKPKGRKLLLSPPEVKVWADQNGLPTIQPPSLREEKNPGLAEKIKSYAPDFAIVASYGKIIPQNILDIPRLGMLNAHPSLLPKLRGASPLQSAILTENETGVTIMRLDADMDHGPIVAQKKIEVADWPPYESDLENLLGRESGRLLVEILPDWLAGKITERPQDHARATFCKKVEKEDGLLNLEDSAETNLRKIRAYHIWPGAYFFAQRGGNPSSRAAVPEHSSVHGRQLATGQRQIRVIVKRASLSDGKLILERVVPEGKKEMDYSAFQRGLR